MVRAKIEVQDRSEKQRACCRARRTVQLRHNGPSRGPMAGKERGMGVLQAAVPAVIICTRDRVRAATFYRETLGLAFAYEDKLAAVFDCGGITLRISVVPDFTPHEHTVLGFRVPDVVAVVKALREKGVAFNIYEGFPQDELGIVMLPGGAIRVAWFKDPDGNVLSVTNI
jgi:hypothetical protein